MGAKYCCPVCVCCSWWKWCECCCCAPVDQDSRSPFVGMAVQQDRIEKARLMTYPQEKGDFEIEMERQKTGTSEDIDRLRGEVMNLQNQVRSTQSQLDTKDRDVGLLLDRLAIQISSHTTPPLILPSDMDLQTKIGTLDSEITKLLKATAGQQQALVSSHQQENIELQNTIQNYQEQIQRLGAEKQQSVIQAENQAALFKQQLDALQASQSSNQSAASDLQLQLQQHQEHIGKLNAEKQTALSHSQNQEASHKEQMDKLQALTQGHESTNLQLQNELLQHKEQVKKLDSEKQESTARAESQAAEYKQQMEKLQAASSGNESATVALQNELQNYKEQVEKLTQLSQDKAASIAQAENQAASDKELIEKLQSQSSGQESATTDMQNQLNNVKEQLAKLEAEKQEQAAKAEKDSSDQNEQLEQLKQAKEAAQSELQNQKDQVASLTKSNEDVAAEIESYKSQVQSLSQDSASKADDATALAERLQKELADAKAEAERLASAAQDLETEKAKAAEDAQKLKEEMKKQLDEQVAKQVEIQNYKDQVNQLTQLNLELNIQIENNTVEESEPGLDEFERGLFVKNRPRPYPIDYKVEDIIHDERRVQIDDNLIFHEIRDQDPEAPMPLKEITKMFVELLGTVVKERRKEPLVKQIVDLLQTRYDKIHASSEINKILAGLSMAYENSDPFGVLICRALQLYHADPLPTLAGFVYANLYKYHRQEGGFYPLNEVISYLYDHIDEKTGNLVVQELQPSDVSEVEFIIYRLRVRNKWTQEDLEKLFEGRESLTDVEFLAAYRESTDIWMLDEPILDLLEDKMTIEDAQFIMTEVEDIEIEEYQLFNSLAAAFNSKIRMDLSYLSDRLTEDMADETAVIPKETIETIFENKRERKILFPKYDDLTVDLVLKRVLKYLEGDVVVRTAKHEYRASI